MHGKIRKSTAGSEKGFSLVELLVAMVVTLIVTGAIYGLLASGQSAFRREPEVADRQQNIRIAMDLIARDIAAAGAGMPPVSMVFSQSDNPGGLPPVLNGAGPQGVLGAAGVAARGDVNDNSDFLEMVGAEESCPVFTTCAGALDGTANTISVLELIPNPGCLIPGVAPTRRGFVMVTDNNRFFIAPAQPGASACAAGGPRGVAVTAALAKYTIGAPAFVNPSFVYAARVTRYMIGINPDPRDPVPALWRSATGRFDNLGAATVAPALVPPGVVPGANWQLVARGIEDLQVEYMNGGGAWANSPGNFATCGLSAPLCAAADWPNVVRQVRVTLSARALAPGLAGQTVVVGGGGPNAIRGQLVTTVTPLAALIGLQSGGQLP